MSATVPSSSSISVILPQLVHHGFVSLSEEVKGDSNSREINVKLKPWNAVKSMGTSHDIIHIPSINVSHHYSSKVDGVQYYEERALYHLFHLNDPSTKVVLVTSVPVSQCVVDYYIGLLDGISRESAWKRLHMISCYDMTNKFLSKKILERPRLLRRIRDIIDPRKSVLSSYMQTDLEDKIAESLGIYNYTFCLNSSFWGSKIGSRICFQETNVPHCAGAYKSLESIDEIVNSIYQLILSKPHVRNLMIKLNEGVSGLGNASLHIPDDIILFISDETAFKAAIASHMWKHLKPCSKDPPSKFLSQVSTVGAIVEEYVLRDNIKSPSVQGFISDDGEVCVVSTHEQLLENQVYKGCIFPASSDYRLQLHEYCIKVGKFLASHGVTHFFGVDFISWEEDGVAKLSAIEINIRMLGTTHPMMTTALLSRGTFSPNDGLLRDAQNRVRCYVSSDAVTDAAFKGLTPDDLMEIIQQTPLLQYNKEECTGCVFYLIDCLSAFGKVGVLYIDESIDKATANFFAVRSTLKDIVTSEF